MSTKPRKDVVSSVPMPTITGRSSKIVPVKKKDRIIANPHNKDLVSFEAKTFKELTATIRNWIIFNPTVTIEHISFSTSKKFYALAIYK